jgi:hypothetical protein
VSVVDQAAEVIAWKWNDMDLGYISSGRVAALIKSLADANLLRPEWATPEAMAVLDASDEHLALLRTDSPDPVAHQVALMASAARWSAKVDAYVDSLGGET